MKLRTGGLPENPPLTAEVTEGNEAFWTSTWNKELVPLVPAGSQTAGRKTCWRTGIQYR